MDTSLHIQSSEMYQDTEGMHQHPNAYRNTRHVCLVWTCADFQASLIKVTKYVSMDPAMCFMTWYVGFEGNLHKWLNSAPDSVVMTPRPLRTGHVLVWKIVSLHNAAFTTHVSCPKPYHRIQGEYIAPIKAAY